MVKVVRSTILPAPVDAVWEILRDFNGHDQWHPAIATSQIERGLPSDKVGAVRKFRLEDGSELREQLLALSDADLAYSYCLLETPIPLFNYVSHVRLIPVTDADHSFWQWEGRFETNAGQEREMSDLVGAGIYQTGFDAIRTTLGLEG